MPTCRCTRRRPPWSGCWWRAWPGPPSPGTWPGPRRLRARSRGPCCLGHLSSSHNWIKRKGSEKVCFILFLYHVPVNRGPWVLPVPEDEVDAVPGAGAGADVAGEVCLAPLHPRHCQGRALGGLATTGAHWNKQREFCAESQKDCV